MSSPWTARRAIHECSVAGRVLDRGGQPVAGATIATVPGRATTLSTASGEFCLAHLEPGEHQLVVTAAGYAVGTASFALAAEPAPEPLRLEIRLAEAFGQEIVVTGTRTAKRLLEVPVHVEQIGRERIVASAARTLADAIEFSSGIRIESNCQNCNFSQVRMLGLEGPYSQILIDGQPTVSSLAMVYGIEQFPTRLLDSIEITKGGGSATYGASAVGGTINLIPHQPDHTHGQIEARYLDTGGRPGSTLSGVLDWASADRTRTLSTFGQIDAIDPVDRNGDGFSEVTQRELRSFGLRLEQYALDSSARLVLDLSRTSADRRGGDLVRFHLPPEQTALTEEIGTERAGATLSWLHTVSSRFDYRAALSWAGTERTSYYGAGFDPNAYGTTDNPVAVADLQMNLYRERGTWTWGLQASRDQITDVQLGYGRVIEETYTDTGLFVQDDRELGERFTLLYGARVDRHSAVDAAIVSPRIALMWSPRDDLTIRSSLARGFRPPATFDEDLHIELLGAGDAKVVRNAPGLREERSLAALLSAEWRPTFGRAGSASLEASLFRTTLDDLHHTFEDDDPATRQIEFFKTNLGSARVAGLEMAAAVRWGSRVQAELGYVVQTARFSEPEPDFGSRDFLRTPEQYGSLTLQLALPAELDLFAGAIYTGPMQAPHYAGFIAEDRLERTPSFVTLDLNLARELELAGQTVTLSVGVKNLTDEYQRDLDSGPDRDSSYVYGPRFPRSWFAGFSLALGD